MFSVPRKGPLRRLNARAVAVKAVEEDSPRVDEEVSTQEDDSQAPVQAALRFEHAQHQPRKLTVIQQRDEGMLDSFPRYNRGEDEEVEEEGDDTIDNEQGDDTIDNEQGNGTMDTMDNDEEDPAVEFFKARNQNSGDLNDDELSALMSSSPGGQFASVDSQVEMQRRVNMLRQEDNNRQNGSTGLPESQDTVPNSQPASDPAETQPVRTQEFDGATQMVDDYVTPVRRMERIEENDFEVPATQDRAKSTNEDEPTQPHEGEDEPVTGSGELLMNNDEATQAVAFAPGGTEEAIESGEDEAEGPPRMDINSSPVGPRVIPDTAVRSKSEMQHCNTPTRNRLLAGTISTSPEIGGPRTIKRRRVVPDSEDRSSSQPPIPPPDFTTSVEPCSSPIRASGDDGGRKFAWARWTDAVYPVEVRGNNDEHEVEVLFGDKRPGGISETNLFELELDIGDEVKIKQDKSRIFIIVDLFETPPEGYREEAEGLLPIRSKNNHQYVKVRDKKHDERRIVPIASLYLTRRMWTHFWDKCESYPTGVFRNCVFALTLEEDSLRVQQAITSRGGTVVSTGLRDLISLHNGELRWADDEVGEYTFAAVLAKDCKRTPKYLEGLALGWPCLSYRYVYDCMEYKELVHHWDSYLLGAGESDVLDKRIISQDISLFKQHWLQNTPLREQLALRRQPLDNVKTTIHIIQPETSKGEDSAAAQVIPLTLTLMGCTCKWIPSIRSVPPGSVTVTVENHRYANTLHRCENMDMIKRIINGQPHQKTLIFNRDWVIQCAINKRIV
ncbi:hypothetical protein TRICI_000933 [Trichomonascus ciferrii]|uniref:BRCT domain-containing protein n=1 Tax=Trichomonascus ciferrii TaxID=44093 RepID=A0A642VCU4_9ASCO|nr:hypothetical protein TRICI_000933 [Trichomonascus ciferrii]